jgi:hypothetical protein
MFSLFLLSGTAQSQVIDFGKFNINQYDEKWTLHEGSGERIYYLKVKFTEDFSLEPEIIISVNMIDAVKEENLRYSIEPDVVTTEGCILEIKTWAESKVNGIAGSWIAIQK